MSKPINCAHTKALFFSFGGIRSNKQWITTLLGKVREVRHDETTIPNKRIDPIHSIQTNSSIKQIVISSTIRNNQEEDLKRYDLEQLQEQQRIPTFNINHINYLEFTIQILINFHY